MIKTGIWGPTALVNDTRLHSSAKVVWLVMALRATATPAEPALLADWTGLDPKTVSTALAELKTAGWLPLTEVQGNLRFPAGLLGDHRLYPRAKLLYGQLQSVPDFRHPSGSFTYPALSHMLATGPNTLKRAIAELTRTGWLTVEHGPTRLHRIGFSLKDPTYAHTTEALARMRSRLARAKYTGEAIMREYLTLLVDSTTYQDDAAPGFLANPFTGELLQLDRYYAEGVGYEFNGPQHEEETDLATWEETVKQVGRDAMKAFICRNRGITLVVVHPTDLSLSGMMAKVKNLLPLREISPDGRLIRALEKRADAYRAKAQRI